MYKTHFGLKREPFSVAADPRFIYMSPQHREAAQHLLYGLHSGAGFILLTGEVGSGKTMVTRVFLHLLPPQADVANVVNPRVDFRSLLLRICEDLRIDVASDSHDLIDAIHGHLLLAHAQGRRTLIIVDEAQALSHEVLELLRLLTNLDSTGRKLQIFLIGQPELRATLRLPALEPVSQRIVARFHLGPLPELETARYIEHRLRKAGLEGPVPFDTDAMRAIHQACRGVPRRINVLCDRAMLTAKNLDTHRIDARMIERISPEVFDSCEAAPQDVAPELPVPTAQHVAEAFAADDPGSGFAGPGLSAAPAGPNRRRRIVFATVGAIAGCLVLGAAVYGLSYLRGPATLAGGRQRHVSQASDTSGPVMVTVPVPIPLPLPTTPPAMPPPAPAPAPAAAAAAAKALLDMATANESTAWRELALLWGVTLPAQRDPCGALVQHRLRCYRGGGDLETLKRLDRPSMLSLTRPDGSLAFVLLLGLGSKTALLGSGDRQDRVPVEELAGSWQGQFATLWRTPLQFHPGITAEDAAMAEWLRERFAVIDGGSDLGDVAMLNRRVAEFQRAHGLQPDAVAGPVTLMALNRASRIDEPALLVER